MKKTYKENNKINETNYFYTNIQQKYFLHHFLQTKKLRNISYYIFLMKHELRN